MVRGHDRKPHPALRMSPQQPQRLSFFRVIEWPTAIALGALAGFLFSLKQINPEVRFEWNLGSLLAFAIGTVVAWFLARAVFRTADKPAAPGQPRDSQHRAGVLRMALFVAVLSLGTLGSLAYALKDISPAKRFDVVVGTGTAFLFVALALYGFWRLVRFLERHGLPEEEEVERMSKDRDEQE